MEKGYKPNGSVPLDVSRFLVVGPAILQVLWRDVSQGHLHGQDQGSQQDGRTGDGLPMVFERDFSFQSFNHCATPADANTRTVFG